MTSEKPICSLSLDLDNKWSYMKTHGDAGWESCPSYLDIVVPRFLKILDEFGWKITVFIGAGRLRNREMGPSLDSSMDRWAKVISASV